MESSRLDGFLNAEDWKLVTIPPEAIRLSIDRIGKANPANVQEIAASQLQLLADYHQIALAQSRRSFFWALVGSGLGIGFLWLQ